MCIPQLHRTVAMDIPWWVLISSSHSATRTSYFTRPVWFISLCPGDVFEVFKADASSPFAELSRDKAELKKVFWRSHKHCFLRRALHALDNFEIGNICRRLNYLIWLKSTRSDFARLSAGRYIGRRTDKHINRHITVIIFLAVGPAGDFYNVITYQPGPASTARKVWQKGVGNVQVCWYKIAVQLIIGPADKERCLETGNCYKGGV